MDCNDADKLIIPYVNEQLEDKKLLEYIEHVQSCKGCYEELEIYYTVFIALQKLEDESNVSYNMRELLTDNLKIMKQTILKKRQFRYCVCIVKLLSEAALIGCLIFHIFVGV